MLLFDPLLRPARYCPHCLLPLPWYCVGGFVIYNGTVVIAARTLTVTVVAAYDVGGGGGGTYGTDMYTRDGTGT